MPDAITARTQTTFAPVPEGEYPCVCVDVIDLGNHVNDKWAQIQHKAAIVYQCEGEDGRRYEVAERFTVSMSDKARLRKFLEQWRGRPYKAEQLEEGVPLDKLAGQGGYITIVHNQVGDRIYANVHAIRPLTKSDAAIKPLNYTRAQYWDTVIAKAVQQGERDSTPADALAEPDDDLPF